MIFISHKNKPDHEYALRISNILQENGINTWIAPESIPSGDDFSLLVPQAINACEMFLLVLTKNTAKSAHVRKEVTLAISHKKTIIPLKIGEFDMDDTYEYLLADVQKIPFTFSDRDIAALVDRCKMGERVIEMEVSKNPTRKVTLLKGDFQDNMMYLMETDPEAFEKTVFVAGLDCSSRFDISSNKGIIKWVCMLLSERYGISMDYLQNLLNKAKMEQLGHQTENEPMKYKDCVLLQIPLTTDDSKILTMNLLLVANSRKSDTYEQTHDVDEVEGIDSREIIMSAFNHCKDLDGPCNMFIGAMGTNGLKFPYEVAVSEILNCYAFAHKLNCKPFNLYFSMRKDDMERVELSVESILSYITTIVNFMK